MPSFYNGKRFFLTYPQCTGTRQDLAEFLRTKAAVKYLLVARELHQDGNQHFHACVEFVNTERHDCRWLDFNGKHPNKQDPRRWAACKAYCKKEDLNFIEEEELGMGTGEESLQEKCFSFDREEDWFEYCASNKIAYPYAQFFWTRLHGDICTILDDEHEGTLCPALRTFNFDRDARESIVLRGPSGCGKTTWAKRHMPKPCLFVSHIDQLKSFRPGYHVSIIFDDVDFKHYPRTGQIAIVDRFDTRAVHCRHAVATIPAGVFKVFTCNEFPVNKSDEAIARRCKFYTVHGWLNEINPN